MTLPGAPRPPRSSLDLGRSPTSSPEMEAMRRIEAVVLEEWVKADRAGERYFPHEFMYKILRGGKLKKSYQIDPKNSWMVAACEKNLPIIVPGWPAVAATGTVPPHAFRR